MKTDGMLTYDEAIEKSFQVEWKLDFCKQGETCWCRIVKPVEPILYMDGEDLEEYWLVSSGNLDKRLAEYLVELHNEKLKSKEK